MTAAIQAPGVSRGIGNVNTALRARALDHGPSGATAVAYSADSRIVSGGHDAVARVSSADGKHAFAGDWSGTVREFSADTGARLFDLSQIVR